MNNEIERLLASLGIENKPTNERPREPQRAMLSSGKMVDTIEVGGMQFVNFAIAQCEVARNNIETLLAAHRAYWAVSENPFSQRKKGGNEN